MRMWVFGYGSLVWNPGFDVADRVIARLPEYHRSFCMRSIHHRGTDAAPGLVLALDATPGAQCHGLALRAHDDQADDVLAYLRERELVSAAYLETRLDVDLEDGRRVEALTLCGRRRSPAILRRHGSGRTGADHRARAWRRGPNTEYLYNTTAHLKQLGIHDTELDWLVDRVRQMCG